MKPRHALALLITLSASQSSLAQVTGPDTFLGIELNKPLSLASCMDRSRDTTRPCYWPAIGYERDFHKTNPSPLRAVKVNISQHPDGMLGFDDYVTTRNGLAVAIKIQTLGITFQDTLLKGLTEKYGEPTTQDVDVLRNGFGREAEVRSAIWTTPTLRVTFYGALTKFDSGEIEVMTLSEYQARKAEKAAREASAPKF